MPNLVTNVRSLILLGFEHINVTQKAGISYVIILPTTLKFAKVQVVTCLCLVHSQSTLLGLNKSYTHISPQPPLVWGKFNKSKHNYSNS